MINELDVHVTDLWKYDDTTISETISKNQDSHVQAAVDILENRASVDNYEFQLNETKCKELRINLNTYNTTSFDSVVVDGIPIDLDASAKTLGLNISYDLKWHCHIDSIIKKAKKRLYSLSQLMRLGLSTRELVQFFCTSISPIIVCIDSMHVLSSMTVSLPTFTSDIHIELGGRQKQAMRIISPFC